MTNEEMVSAVKWSVDVADEYRVPVSKVMQLYRAIRKHHGDIETRNLIEKGFSTKGE